MAVIVRCIRGSGNKEGPPIHDSLIVTEDMARLRGKRYLDDPSQGKYYTTLTYSVSVPHQSDTNMLLRPRQWITINVGNLGTVIAKIKSHTVNINRTEMRGMLAVQIYNDPPEAAQ